MGLQIGTDYISKCGKYHLRILGFKAADHVHKNDPFLTYTIITCGYYSYIPLTNNPNGSINPEGLKSNYILKSHAAEVLFGSNSKRG